MLGAWCRERKVTTEYVACIKSSPTLDDAERCRPRSDSRPSSQRPSERECEAVAAHIDQLVAEVLPGGKAPSEQARRVARMECVRWETRARLECQLAVKSLDELDRCGL